MIFEATVTVEAVGERGLDESSTAPAGGRLLAVSSFFGNVRALEKASAFFNAIHNALSLDGEFAACELATAPPVTVAVAIAAFLSVWFVGLLPKYFLEIRLPVDLEEGLVTTLGNDGDGPFKGGVEVTLRDSLLGSEDFSFSFCDDRDFRNGGRRNKNLVLSILRVERSFSSAFVFVDDWVVTTSFGDVVWEGFVDGSVSFNWDGFVDGSVSFGWEGFVDDSISFNWEGCVADSLSFHWEDFVDDTVSFALDAVEVELGDLLAAVAASAATAAADSARNILVQECFFKLASLGGSFDLNRVVSVEGCA